MSEIRLIIADSFPVVREGLRAVLAAQTDVNIVAEAADGEEALTKVVELGPDILLTEMDLPGCSGLELIKRVGRRASDTAVLVVSSYREEHYAAAALRAGALGFVTKTRSPKELVDAVSSVGQGHIFVSPQYAQRVIKDAFGGHTAKALHEQLTPREQEIFLKLARGRRISDIAERLHLSPKTVSTHKTRICRKLGLDSVAALVRYAVDHELV